MDWLGVKVCAAAAGVLGTGVLAFTEMSETWDARSIEKAKNVARREILFRLLPPSENGLW